MKKIPLLITAGILALCVGGYFIYEKLFVTRYLSPWDLVPENTVAVYEPGNCTTCIEPVTNSPVWEVIKKAAFYGGMQDSLRNLFSFLSTPKTGSLVSLHVTRKDDFDFVFYVPVVSETKKNIFDAIFEEWKEKNGKYFREREYNGIKIQELTFQKQVFSWVTLDNVWIGSFTPFLVEDVIRVFGKSEGSPFRNDLSGLYQLPHISKDAGNLYVHLPRLADWFSVFSPEVKQMEAINNFGKASLLDIKADDHFLVLNGFTMNAADITSTLSVFNDQTPTSYDLKQYVSNRTVLMATYGISDGAKFGERMSDYPLRKSLEDTLKKINTSLKFKSGELYKVIDNEVGVCYLESGGRQLSKILIVESSQPEIWLDALNGLSEKLSVDTVFYEQYADYDIKEVPLFKFPEKILWPFVTGFEHCYYTFSGKYIIMGDDLEELKLFLDDIVKEDTWGKSVAQNKFLESALLESNMGLYVNTSLALNVLYGTVNQRWKQYLTENKRLLSSLGMGAIQFSNLNESFYTNVLWQFKEPDRGQLRSKPVNSTLTSLNHGIMSPPYIVRSHVDKSDEVLLQDSSHQIYLVAQDGKVLWSLMVNGPIKGNVDQIDYFKNGKIQYLFATPGTVHIIDRLGNYIDGFPLEVTAKEIEYVSVIDYDHSKNYRFLIAERSGKLWMYDKNGINLDGWAPGSAGGSLLTYARHHRIRGRDYIVAIRKDGKVYAFNRRGELLKAFPLDLNARPAGEYFLESGNSLANTSFVVVSRDGFRIKFNLEGKIVSRETLIKTAIESQFSLITDKNRRSYVMVRRDNKRIDILDQQGKDFIANEFVGSNSVEVQYFDFGAGKVFYVITDFVQDLSFIYDAQGNLISYPPVESYAISLKPSESNQVLMYFTYGKSLAIKPLY